MKRKFSDQLLNQQDFLPINNTALDIIISAIPTVYISASKGKTLTKS